MSSLLEEFPVILEIPVAWGDMDAFNHVNNTVYFRYFESVRISYFEQIQFLEFMEKQKIGPILAETNCKFRKPLFYPAKIKVGARVKEVIEYGFIHHYRIIHQEKPDQIVAEGEGTLISYHYQEKHKVPLPAELLKRIEVLEKKTFSQ